VKQTEMQKAELWPDSVTARRWSCCWKLVHSLVLKIRRKDLLCTLLPSTLADCLLVMCMVCASYEHMKPCSLGHIAQSGLISIQI